MTIENNNNEDSGPNKLSKGLKVFLLIDLLQNVFLRGLHGEISVNEELKLRGDINDELDKLAGEQ